MLAREWVIESERRAIVRESPSPRGTHSSSDCRKTLYAIARVSPIPRALYSHLVQRRTIAGP